MEIKLDRDAIDTVLQKIDSFDIEKISIAEIELLLQPLFNGYKISTPVFDPGLLIYRGRVCSKPYNYSEIIYPKSEYVKQYGRANDIGKSMFYAAVGRAAPFAEIGVKTDDTVVMSYWITKEKMILNHVGFTSDIAELLLSNRELNSIYDFVKKTTNFNDLNQFIYNYLASKFIIKIDESENLKYKLSVAITNKLLGKPFSGIMYPSVALFGNSDNIVLTPDFVDNHLQLISIEFVKIKNVNGTEYTTDILDTATEISKDGTVQWSGKLLSWTTAKDITALSENGEWLKKDSDGKLILPRCDGDLISSLTPLKKLYKKETEHCIKITKEFTINQKGHNAIVLISLIFMTNGKEKYISIYIPNCFSPTDAATVFIRDYKKFENMNEGNIIEMRNKNNGIEFISTDSILTNKVEIYSEALLNEGFLREQFKKLALSFVYDPDIKINTVPKTMEIVYHYVSNK
jgi:hypothetical protein